MGLQMDVAAQLHRVGQHHLVFQHAIVRDVCVAHDVTASADHGAAGGRGAAVDRGVFANPCPLADLDASRFAPILEILRLTAHHRPDPDIAATPHDRIALDHRVRRHPGVVGQCHPGSHHCVRSHRHVAPEGGAPVDHGRGVDEIVHWSTTRAIISASAATCPSTSPTPRIFTVFPCTCTVSTSNRSWSPGTTGRRNFTPSMDMKYTSLFSA